MKTDARIKVIFSITISVLIIGLILILSFVLNEQGLTPNAGLKNLSPSSSYLFGTDSMGRDMLVRTVRGIEIFLVRRDHRLCDRGYDCTYTGDQCRNWQ